MAKEILTPSQKKFIRIFSENKTLSHSFYLGGGTALAVYYLRHRYSEDLDFFSPREIELSALNAFLKTLKKPLNITKTDFQQSFNRNIFFLHSRSGILKTEFTFFPFTQIEKTLKKDGILIDSLMDIAVNKIFTIYQNPRARDFIDLYLILKKHNELALPKLFKNARIKFDTHIDPLQLGTQLLKARTLQDIPRMLEKTNHQQWRNFFIRQAEELSPKILA